jgi:calcium-dependent protein kinase
MAEARLRRRSNDSPRLRISLPETVVGAGDEIPGTFRRENPEADYAVMRVLGEGSFGVVRLGIHHRTGEKVAIKFTRRDLSEVKRRQVFQEVETMEEVRRLTKSHPNLVKMRECFYWDEQIIIVLQLWEGGDLLEAIAVEIGRGRLIADARAAVILAQLAHALNALHTVPGGSYVHRDVKPENVFLEDDSESAAVLLGDFGMAQWVPRTPANPECVIETSDFFGTLAYSAPENHLSPRQFSPKSDMWGLGVVLYVMVSGVFPFFVDDSSPAGKERTIRSIRSGAFGRLPDSVSSGASDLIGRLLLVDPSERLDASGVLAHPWVRSAATGIADVRVAFNLPTFDASASRGDGAAASPAEHLGTISRLTSHGTLSASQLRLASERFGAEAGDRRCLSLEQFERVMKALDLKGMPYERVFAVFDGDKDGSIDADEFLCGLARLTEPSEERLRVVFSMYASGRDGAIDAKHLALVLRACATDDDAFEEVKLNRLRLILRDMDVDRTGKVTFPEFASAVARDPMLLKLLLQPNLHFKRFVARMGTTGVSSPDLSSRSGRRQWSLGEVWELIQNGKAGGLITSTMTVVGLSDTSLDPTLRERNNIVRFGILILVMAALVKLIMVATE